MLAAVALAGCGGASAGPGAAEETVPVVEVVDGDTVRVRLDGRVQPVRVIGIDTPEPYREGRPECYALQASEEARRLLAGRDVVLVADEEDRDRYDRLLRYVEVDRRDFGAAMLRGGYADTIEVEPNTSRAPRYAALRDEARSAGAGLWGACRRQDG